MSDHTQVPLVDLSPQGDLVNERPGDGFSSEMFADAAIEFIEGYEDDKPFYAYVAFTAPHDPRQPPSKFPPLNILYDFWSDVHFDGHKILFPVQ